MPGVGINARYFRAQLSNKVFTVCQFQEIVRFGISKEMSTPLYSIGNTCSSPFPHTEAVLRRIGARVDLFRRKPFGYYYVR
jgi:hypothetical protein